MTVTRSAESATHFDVEARFQRFAMIQFSNPWGVGVAPGSYEEGAVGANKQATEAAAISPS